MTQGSTPYTSMPSCGFFDECAFLCIDIQQEDNEDKHICQNQMPKIWAEMGFTADDVNAAKDYARQICYPNAVRVAATCRLLEIPMIFVHWGSLYPDRIDLDPEVRKILFSDEQMKEISRNSGKLRHNEEKPADFLGVREQDYVLPKTAQDAFRATSLEFMLQNLNVKNLIMIGGHTGACLGKTAKTAKKKGFITLCVEDATFNAFESNRIAEIVNCQYDYVVRTDELVELIGQIVNDRGSRK